MNGSSAQVRSGGVGLELLRSMDIGPSSGQGRFYKPDQQASRAESRRLFERTWARARCIEVNNLITRLNDTALRDSNSHWFDVVPSDMITFVEQSLDSQLPVILKCCYTEISNGGFGPAYGLTGLPGGYASSWGDLIQATAELRKLDDCDESWLPLFDFGCAEMLCVDVDDDLGMVASIEGEFHHEKYDLIELLERWCKGEIPDLRTGGFIRT